ncbi:quinol:cytochrome c oxidoreductase quinone-binding subunit 2 [Flavobacterium gillisiae]|uniref:Quinol:cytochrome c oxidoreductase quinone-binding subunit 2 n=1 Tax=Flavobacterium gillisiae TaxID=150146 RepID=A0A1H3WN41_9FLAO|nr:quinol:cytochrome C oxidoreductase [Flavobacterium gillisiae]SDZ87618.1 quinol:cytochrome c oxidoreductase quinone-binding subunit 2 [Flavobacterium gillisiae]
MYTFSSKLKTFSIILMAVGLLGIGYGFLTAPKDIQEVEKILASESHGGHGEVKHEVAAEAEEADTVVADHKEVEAAVEATEAHAVVEGHNEVAAAVEPTEAHAAVENHSEVSEAAEHEEHLTHVLHQLQNKPWAALYVACIFFMLISMGVLAFYAIQQVAQAGWSPVLFRVMQGITAYLPVGSVLFFIFLVLCGLHFNHLFIWLDPEVVAHDKLIATKSGYLNFPFWIVRAAIFLIGWNLYRYYSAKNCLAQDESNDDSFYKKNFNISAGFLVFFIVTESIMSWDWIMSIDPHWFSTLFGWYVFASFFVSGITMIAMVTLYLKSRGYLEHVNTSHIHDLAKFMFGFSVFWTYLWFSQFMLIWYANIPEEITYFITRIELYNLPFFGAIVMNFLFPILILVNTDFKRITWILVMAGVVILAGHYIDFFNMIMPGTVGDRWFIGISEIASVLFFLGLFIFVVFTALAKSPLLPKRNPYIEESKHFHY